MSVYGTRLLGKCDAVPGFFHVATQFFHINYVPLAPLQTYIVLSRDGNQFRGVKIRLSGKTVGLAWARFITCVLAFYLVAFAIVQCLDKTAPFGNRATLVGCAVGMVAAYIFVMWHRVCTHASLARACELGSRVGLSEAGFAELYKLYGQALPEGFAVVPRAQPAQPIYAPAPDAVAAEEAYPCRACGNHFPADACYGEADGQIICHDCWSASNAQTAG